MVGPVTAVKERYTTAGSDNEYAVVDTVTGRPIPRLGGQAESHSTREKAQAEADRLNAAYERTIAR